MGIMNKTIYMTAVGHEKAKTTLVGKLAEYDQMRQERKLAHDLSGDGWHDNPHLNRLQQLEAEMTREIVRLQSNLKQARVVFIDEARRPTDAVRMGSLVRLTPLENPPYKAMTWEIVGFDETDIVNGRLAYNSPLGEQLIGKEEGETITMHTVDGNVTYLIDTLYSGAHPDIHDRASQERSRRSQ